MKLFFGLVASSSYKSGQLMCCDRCPVLEQCRSCLVGLICICKYPHKSEEPLSRRTHNSDEIVLAGEMPPRPVHKRQGKWAISLVVTKCV